MNRQSLLRIPLSKLMDLKVDFAFKQMFGSEKNKQITIVFLNAILQRTGHNTINEIIFSSQEVGGEYEDDKQSRLDIVVRTQNDEFINIEVQLADHHDIIKRTLYYWSRLYTSQLQKGKVYSNLRHTITINICNFTVFEQLPNYHSMFHLCEDSTKQRLKKEDDVLEIHFIEMNKFLNQWYRNELKPLDDVLARWLLLLGMVDARKKKVYHQIYEELEVLAMKDKDILEAIHAWQDLSQSERFAYESRLKYILDEQSKLHYARHKGLEEGAQKEKVETAQKLIDKNMDNEFIMEVTKLSLEQVEEIRKKYTAQS